MKCCKELLLRVSVKGLGLSLTHAQVKPEGTIRPDLQRKTGKEPSFHLGTEAKPPDLKNLCSPVATAGSEAHFQIWPCGY